MIAQSRLTARLLRCKERVEKFNADLEAYYKVSGQRELPYFSRQGNGYAPFEPYSVRRTKAGLCVRGNGIKVSIRASELFGRIALEGWDDEFVGMRSILRHERLRLWRAWKMIGVTN